MTQQDANKIFETELGQQLPSIYSTSDDRVFIRYEEAVAHTNHMINSTGGQEFVDTTITEWFPEPEKKNVSSEELSNIAVDLEFAATLLAKASEIISPSLERLDKVRLVGQEFNLRDVLSELEKRKRPLGLEFEKGITYSIEYIEKAVEEYHNKKTEL